MNIGQLELFPDADNLDYSSRAGFWSQFRRRPWHLKSLEVFDHGECGLLLLLHKEHDAAVTRGIQARIPV
jgi:hypothetical protein